MNNEELILSTLENIVARVDTLEKKVNALYDSNINISKSIKIDLQNVLSNQVKIGNMIKGQS